MIQPPCYNPSIQNGSDQLFVTLYMYISTSIYILIDPSGHKQLSEPFWRDGRYIHTTWHNTLERKFLQLFYLLQLICMDLFQVYQSHFQCREDQNIHIFQ